MSFADEPALILSGGGAIVEAVVVLLIAFGVPITPEQKGAISALATVIITVATGVLIRTQVTPTSHVAATTAPVLPIKITPPPAA